MAGQSQFGDLRFCDGVGRVIDPDEHAHRQRLFSRAQRGDEQALAYVRDEWHVRTWQYHGRMLIDDGVLVGARHGRRQ